VRQLAPGTSWEQARELCRSGRVLVDGEVVTDPVWRMPRTSLATPATTAARTAPAGAAPAEPASPRIELVRMAAARRTPEAARDGEAEWEGEPREDGAAAAARLDTGLAARPPARQHLVVYADADVVVVRKPAGILTVPFERGDRDTLLALARVALRRREGREGRAAASHNPTLRAVQRLDKDTSGLLVFARNVAAQRHLQDQLASREVVRRYEALVHGTLPHDVTFDTWLIADRGDGLRGSRGANPDSRRKPQHGNVAASPGALTDGARQAVTHVRVLERLRGATRISCELETGRQHQIRIHLAEAGHPLIGETVYMRDFRAKPIAAPRPMLHAAALGFRQPRDERFVLFEEPPPADFALLLERLRRRRQ
jgi:23S rRNA pseudouridine1911/1915/1917 synthase